MQHKLPKIGAQANADPPPALPARFAVPLTALHFGAVAAHIEAALDHADELARGETGDMLTTMQGHIAIGREALDTARRITSGADMLTEATTARKAGEQVALAFGALVELGRIVGEALEAADPINNRLSGRIVLMERRTSGRGRYRVA